MRSTTHELRFRKTDDKSTHRTRCGAGAALPPTRPHAREKPRSETSHLKVHVKRVNFNNV